MASTTVIVCLPSVPKAITHFRGKPWFLQIENSLRSMLHLSPQNNEQTSERKVATIGGGGQNNLKGTAVSDAEFRDLMKTGNSDISRIDSAESVLDQMGRGGVI
jgi:hypothetical protein